MKATIRRFLDRLFRLFPSIHPGRAGKPWFLGLAAIGGFVISGLFLSGCNVFDALDTSTSDRSQKDLLNEGNIALESGDFGVANELFSRLYDQGTQTDAVLRGRGEALAGMAGFTVLKILDVLQNGTGPYDKGTIFFRTAYLISDRPGLEAGLSFMMRIGQPDHSDRISRALMKVAVATRLILEKYDTNKNKKLDIYDQIDFDTNDANTPAWPNLFPKLVTGPSSDGSTLEQAFLDLAYGFDGRGDEWTFLSPYGQRRVTGTYTPSARRTITALGDFVDRLEAVNPHFNLNESTFIEGIRNLDGED